MLQAGTQRVGLGGPRFDRVGLVEGEDGARAWGGVAGVAEEGFGAGGFERERQLSGADLEIRRQLRRVVRRLLGFADEQGAGAFGFDDTERLPVNDQQLVAAATGEWHFTQRDATRRAGVVAAVVLNGPAGGDEEGVDLQAGKLFRGHQDGAAGGVRSVAALPATTSAPRKRRRTIWMWLRSEYSSSA